MDLIRLKQAVLEIECQLAGIKEELGMSLYPTQSYEDIVKGLAECFEIFDEPSND